MRGQPHTSQIEKIVSPSLTHFPHQKFFCWLSSSNNSSISLTSRWIVLTVSVLPWWRAQAWPQRSINCVFILSSTLSSKLTINVASHSLKSSNTGFSPISILSPHLVSFYLVNTFGILFIRLIGIGRGLTIPLLPHHLASRFVRGQGGSAGWVGWCVYPTGLSLSVSLITLDPSEFIIYISVFPSRSANSVFSSL